MTTKILLTVWIVALMALIWCPIDDYKLHPHEIMLMVLIATPIPVTVYYTGGWPAVVNCFKFMLVFIIPYVLLLLLARAKF